MTYGQVRTQEARQEGIEIGLLKGVKEGLQQGKEEGLQQGKEEGLQQGKEESIQSIARNMLKKGFELTSIQELTGLTLGELKILK
jgi:predicted transposase/invertase (TIGR01784 family)